MPADFPYRYQVLRVDNQRGTEWKVMDPTLATMPFDELTEAEAKHIVRMLNSYLRTPEQRQYNSGEG